MKTIKCRRCRKNVDVEDDYQFKTCSICRVKDREDRRVKSELKKTEKKLSKDLKLDKAKMPRMLWSYKNYCDTYSGYGWKKPSFKQYKEQLEEWVKHQIQMEADLEIEAQKRALLEEKRLKDDPWSSEGFLTREPDIDDAMKKRYLYLVLWLESLPNSKGHL